MKMVGASWQGCDTRALNWAWGKNQSVTEEGGRDLLSVNGMGSSSVGAQVHLHPPLIPPPPKV